MNKKLFSNTILYTLGEVVPRILSFLMMPIFTRYLLPSDYGILSYTNSVIAFIYAFCTLSLNTYVLRFYFDCKTEDEKQRLIGNIFLFIAMVNLVVLLFLNLTGEAIVKKANITISWKPYLCFAIINNFLESFSIIPMVYYRVKQNAKAFVTISLGRCVLQYLFTFIMLVPMGMGLISQYYGRIFTLLPFFFIYVIIIVKNGKINLNGTQIKAGLKYSLPLLPGTMSYLVLTSLDRIILERYVTLEIIGIYNIAYTIAFALNMVIQSFYRAFEPNIFQKYTDYGNGEVFVSYMHRVNNIYNFLLYALAIALSLFAKEALMIIASEKYYAAAFYVPPVLVGVIFSGRKLLMDCALAAEKRSVISGIGTMIGAGVSLVTNIILIPRIGVIAAPIALAVSYMVMNLYVKIFTKIRFFKNMQDLLGMLIFLSISALPMLNLSMNEFAIIGIKIALYVLSMALLFLVFNIKDFISAYKTK